MIQTQNVDGESEERLQKAKYGRLCLATHQTQTGSKSGEYSTVIKVTKCYPWTFLCA